MAGGCHLDAASDRTGEDFPSELLLLPVAAVGREDKVLIPTDMTPTRCGECCRMYCLWPRASVGDTTVRCGEVWVSLGGRTADNAFDAA